jgi:protein ImuA
MNIIVGPMLQTRNSPRAGTLRLADGIDLARARAHEASGPARQLFALLAGALTEGPILWLHPMWGADGVFGDGAREFLDPGRIVFGKARTAKEILWAAEEALRTGVVPLVVVELADPPGLTPVRRLHLAAEEGTERHAAPLALILTLGRGGAAGVETRWHLRPVPGLAIDGIRRWRLSRLRARSAPEASWEMTLRGGRIRLAP